MQSSQLLFITRTWEGVGGMQRLARDLWRGMEGRYGTYAELCAPIRFEGGGIEDRDEYRNTGIQEYRSPVLSYTRTRVFGFVYFLTRALLSGIAAACAGYHIHLLDATLAPFGWIFKTFGKGRVTITVCGLDVIWKPRWYQWVLRKTLPKLDRVVCISHATAEEVRKRGVSEERVVVIPPGVWPKEVSRYESRVMSTMEFPLIQNSKLPFRACPRLPLGHELEAEWRGSGSRRGPSGPNGKTQNFPVIFSLCRLIPRKGISWFVSEVLPLLLVEYPSIQYVVSGSGTDERLIKKIVQEKGLAGHVHLCGNMTEEQREELLRSVDLLIVPNVHREGDMEGFGISCIEASARGVPVVAAHIEGLQDAVRQGVTGRFFESRNAQDCVRVIREMLEKPFERFQVSSATLGKFDWMKLMERYEEEVFVTVGEEYSSPTVIGIVTWDYAWEGRKAVGGMGRAIYEMVEAMREKGIEAKILTNLFSHHLLFSLSLPFTLQKWIDRNGIQMLLIPTGPGGLFLFKKPKRCRLHLVSYHTYAQQSALVPGEKWKRVFVPFEKRTLKMADSVLCYCEDTRRVLMGKYGLGEGQVKFLPQILDVERWKPKEPVQKEPGLCVYVGRLERRKGIEVLLEAWKQLLRMYRCTGTSVQNPHLVIVGEGSNLPFLPQKELVALVQKAELCICPSYLEGFGLAAAEAMAAGTAVIASDTDGLRSLIRHRETGWLVPPGDPKALAEAVAKLLQDRELRETLTRRAQEETQKRFDRERAVSAMKFHLC